MAWSTESKNDCDTMTLVKRQYWEQGSVSMLYHGSLKMLGVVHKQ